MKNRMKNYLPQLGMVMLMLLMCLSISPMEVVAKEEIQDITISASYRHPVSGAIADSGGEAAYATGQGMVEGAVGTSGKLEQTEDGSYYLTVTMRLIDFSSEHIFAVQESQEKPWVEIEPEVVGTGSDSNGTTQDFRIKVLDATSIVKCEMYVAPMGRNVIFFITAGDYIEENGLMEVKTDEAVAGVIFSTDEDTAESSNQKLDSSKMMNVNHLLYLIVAVLVCAITGMLVWNLKIRKQQKQQEELWEKEDES